MAYQTNKTYVLFSHGGAGRCLTVYGGVANNNQNVCLFRQVGTTAQNWTIKAFGSNFKLVTGLNQNYALNYYWSAGQGKPGNCDIYPQAGNDADSSIILEPVCTDVYRIKLKNYNLYLTAKGDDDSADVRWEAPVSMSSDYTALAPQEWRILDPAEKGIRAPFIFVGYFNENAMYKYTDDQLAGLGNATEFVINSGSYSGYFNTDGTPNSNGSIQSYVVEAADMAKRLYLMYGKQVWIGTPGVGYSVTYSKTVFEEVGRRMTYFIDNIITEFGRIGLNFNTVVKGIYMHDEEILHPFTTSTPISSNWQVNMFQTVSNYAASKGKKMLWSPYWNTEYLERAACIIHRTNIFDYVVVQPSYYFSPNFGNELSCGALRKAIAIQRLCYSNGMPILHESAITCTKTVIGCQMEIDYRYNTDTAYKTRYNTYEEVFNQSYGAYNKYPANFGFYFGCPYAPGIFEPNEETKVNNGYNVVKAVVNNFFK